jgi:hypothetical protein
VSRPVPDQAEQHLLQAVASPGLVAFRPEIREELVPADSLIAVPGHQRQQRQRHLSIADAVDGLPIALEGETTQGEQTENGTCQALTRF